MIEWTCVVDDGTRPYGPGVAIDQRRPLRIVRSETTQILVSLVNPVGGVVTIAPSEFLQLNARTSCTPVRQIFTARSLPVAGRRYGLTVAAADTKNLVPQQGVFDLWLVRGVERVTLIQLSEFDLLDSALGNNFL